MMKRVFFITVFFSLLVLKADYSARAQDVVSLSRSDSCMIAAQMAYNLRQTDSIKILCNQALHFNPANDAAYFMLAKIALEENNLQEAERALKAAADIDSTNYYYLATLGAVYLGNNDIPSAINLYETLASKFPAKTDAYENLMDLYVPRGMSDKALSLADRLEEKIGPNTVSTMARFRIYSGRRDHQKAIEALVKADQASPNEMYETYIADLYAGLRKDSLALEYYSKALALAPDYVPALYGKMEAFRRFGNYPLYLAYLKTFLANRQTNSQIKKMHLEEVLKTPVFYQQYRKEMADCIMEYANVEPADSSAAITGAIFLSRLGHFSQAGQILDRTLNYYPQDRYIRQNMLSFLYSTENWGRLESFADSSMSLFPDQALDLFQFKGMAEFYLKKYDQAISTFLSQEKTVKKQKDTATLLQIYSLVGDMYHNKKDDKTAFKYYEKALKIDPKNTVVLNNYAWYIATRNTTALPNKKELGKAVAMAKTAVENSSGEYHNLDTYAWVLFLNGNTEEAKKYMQQAVAYGGADDVGILTRYSDILTSLGEYDIATIYYSKALQMAAQSGDQAEVDKLTARIERVKALQEAEKK